MPPSGFTIESGWRSVRSWIRIPSLLILLFLTSCTTANNYIVPTTSQPMGAQALMSAQKKTMEAPPLPAEPGPYRVGPGDVLSIRDLDHPDLFLGRLQTSVTPEMYQFTVSDDGRLYLPLLGTVNAQGRTVPELRDFINESFRKYIREPNISVGVVKYESQKVFVLGQVQVPGAYPYDGRMSVLDAIGQAKGLNEKADTVGSYLIRKGKLLPVNFYALLRKGDLSQNILLAGGDVIHIADSSDRKVYVLGEVRKPGVYPMGSEPMRLIDAISMAGGLDLVTAKKGNILLIRGTYADPEVYQLNLSDVMDITATETILQPGDRIYATATGLTNWNRAITQLLPFLQAGQAGASINKDLK